MITFKDIQQNPDIRTYIQQADASLYALGYTEHSFAHVERVSSVSAKILTTLGYPARTVELAKIAGFLHDIGNLVNRHNHSQSGAIMAFELLCELGMSADEVSLVVSAIGNHDEGTGVAVNPVAAALILADKSDVRRSRVRNQEITTFDIHDRVNYSVVSSTLTINESKTDILLSLDIDTSISPVMDYFEIFLERMIMCRKAAQSLGLAFRLSMNGQSMM